MQLDSNGIVAGNTNNISTSSGTQGTVTPIGCWSYWYGTGTLKVPSGGTWAVIASCAETTRRACDVYSAGANLITTTSSYTGYALGYRVS